MLSYPLFRQKMYLASSKPLHTLYQVLLILATLGLTFYCIHKYRLDHSLSLVDFKRFHYSERDLYPSLSLCFTDSISKDKFAENYEGRKKVTYTSFLSGYVLDEYLNENYLDVDYKDVAINADEYFDRIMIQLGNGTKMIHKLSKTFTWVYNKNNPSQEISWIPEIKIKNIGPLTRCFTLDSPYIPKQAIDYVRISLNKSVFQSGAFLDRFQTLFSYPNQILRSGFTSKLDWKSLFDEKDNHKEITLEINVENMRVINYRNKPDNPCHSDWLNDDKMIYDQMLQDVGCRAPYLSGKENVCRGQKKMIHWRDILTRFKHTPSSMDIIPCRVIRNLRYNPKIDIREEAEKNLFSIVVRYPEYYMEIEHVKEYTLESLVGNAGGYLGLFLGYALLQLPELVSMAYTMLKTMILRAFGPGQKYRDHQMEKSAEWEERGKTDSEGPHYATEISLMKEQLNTLKYDMTILKRFNIEH